MKFKNRLVLSAMAGINDAEFCKRQKAGLVILGGFNADKGAIEAAMRVSERGRKEFIFGNPLEGIENELKKIKGKNFAVNIRSSTIEGFVEVAQLVDEYGGILEINAHCRQPEFIKAGCGEWLLFNPQKLFEIIRAVSKIAITSVKIRGGHEIDYHRLCEKIRKYGGDIVHVDAMVLGGRNDLKLISTVSRACFTIGNNSFVDIKSGEEIIKAGAKMASAARAVLKNPDFFEEMLKSDLLSQPVELNVS